jgi:hypothetical protein
MKSIAPAVLLAAAFLAGVLYLFHIEFAAGEVYPEYSSLRTDPRGSNLLYDALSRLPGVNVGRNYLPLDSTTVAGAAILLLGIDPLTFPKDSDLQVRAEKVASAGNRVVLAFERLPKGKTPEPGSLYRNWDVTLAAGRRLYFAVAKNWRTLEQIGGNSFAIERDFGKGSIVLIAESGDFANVSVAAADRLPTVTAALGGYSRIVFDEEHLGIAESGSVVGLARRFRLTGMAIGLALCAALFLWRSASGFPPAAERAADRLAGRTSHAGLLTLLRRHIPPERLAEACWGEWLHTNRRRLAPGTLEQGAAAARAASDPVQAIREIQTLVESKGAL